MVKDACIRVGSKEEFLDENAYSKQVGELTEEESKNPATIHCSFFLPNEEAKKETANNVCQSDSHSIFRIDKACSHCRCGCQVDELKTILMSPLGNIKPVPVTK